MTNTANKVLQYIRSEVKFSGVSTTPVGIDDIQTDLNASESEIIEAIKDLVSNGMVEYCGIGESCVRLTK